MSCPGTLGRFLTYGFDSFLGLFANSFRRLLRFSPTVSAACLVFSPTVSTPSLIFSPASSPHAYVLDCFFLPKTRQRSGCEQSYNQTCYSHDFPPVL